MIYLHDTEKKIRSMLEKERTINNKDYILRSELKKKLGTHDKPLSNQLRQLEQQKIITINIDPFHKRRKRIRRGTNYESK